MPSLLAPNLAAPALAPLFFELPAYESMLTLEDGTIVEDADTFALEATVATYATRYGLTWTGSGLLNEQAILRAMVFIESFESRLYGYRVSSRQELSWPRYDVFDLAGGWIPSNEVPSQIVSALCEAAILELADPGVLVPADIGTSSSLTTRREKVGPLERELKYATANDPNSPNRFKRIVEWMRPFIRQYGVIIEH